MKVRKPDYYDRFRCIAGACGDSCCIGWEIDINQEQRPIYEQFSKRYAEATDSRGELGRRMKTCIDWENGHFILQGKEERCPFLNREKLCDLILELGEDSLCDICREHPRFYDWYDGLTEVGVGLCCEAAGRLILEKEEPVRFVTVEGEDSAENVTEAIGVSVKDVAEADGDELAALAPLFAAREQAIAILQDRNRSIWQRLSSFVFYVGDLQEELDFGGLEGLEDVSPELECEEIPWNDVSLYRDMLQICGELEAIDDSWPQTIFCLETLTEDPDEFTALQQEMMTTYEHREYEYEHLAVCFLYRYFMKCRADGDLLSRGRLAVFCVLLIHLLDIRTYQRSRKLTTEDRVQNAKCVSKEIEYSEENLELLAEIFWNQRGQNTF